MLNLQLRCPELKRTHQPNVSFICSACKSDNINMHTIAYDFQGWNVEETRMNIAYLWKGMSMDETLEITFWLGQITRQVSIVFPKLRIIFFTKREDKVLIRKMLKVATKKLANSIQEPPLIESMECSIDAVFPI